MNMRIDRLRAVRAGSALVLLLLLAACAGPLQRSVQGDEPAMAKSSDAFWQHIESGTRHDWFYLLNEGEEAMRWRLRMIDSAHHSIDMETFLWSADTAGSRVVNHLLAAADRGVKVRLLVDDSFTVHADLALLSLDAHPNVALRVYNPYRERGGGVVGRTLFNLDDFHRVNHRLHNKTLIVDGWAVLVGGRNMANEYFGLDDLYNFRDMELLAMGNSVAQAGAHFAAFWNSDWTFPATDVFGSPPAGEDLAALRARLWQDRGEPDMESERQLEAAWRELASSAEAGGAAFVADEPLLKTATQAPTQLGDYIVEQIASAQREVILVSAYFVPTERLATLIESTIARGVRVRVLTNSMRSNNHLPAHAAYHGYVRRLVEAGVELYELRVDAEDRNLYMRGPVEDKKLGLHAKFMLLDDDRVMVGSSNLDPRSLKLNTEVGLMVTSPELNRALRAAIAVDFLPRNAWSVQLDEAQRLVWVNDSERLYHPPAESTFQQLEDWFLGLLPIDAEM